MRADDLTHVIFNYLMCGCMEAEPDYSWRCILKDDFVMREVQIRY